ncbi:MAG: 3'-phosphoesterase [Parachlamydiales bacterium]|nr:3'-phosphoesterase [Parachlamydiales bacterium]
MKEERIFVVQKHFATHLHYDFRLQVGKVLKSWAVPKGLPTVKNVKRLAIVTEDHPLAYADFEGEIPQGEYGAGKVVIWDKGTYQNVTVDEKGLIIPLNKGIHKGHLDIVLSGKRFRGSFTLIHFREKNWLIIKR